MNNKSTELDFAADAIIAHLRQGNRPTDSEAAFLDRRPLIDAFRQRITSNDLDWLLGIVNTASEPVAGLACSLLRHHVSAALVKSAFGKRWDSARPYLKNRLMWRMLDDPELPKEWHQRFFEFVLAEWETFRDFNLTFYGNSRAALGRILTRITDPSFPDSKKWIYLCCPIEVVDDQDAAKAVVFLGRSMTDPFAQHVAEVLLQRFYPSAKEASLQRASSSITSVEGTEVVPTLNFTADAIVSSMRENKIPGEEEADYLNRLPIVDLLRKRIKEEDLVWVREVLNEQSGEVAGLYLSLLRNFDTQAEVQEFLRSSWEEAPPFLRAHLMWRILDAPELSEEWHQKLFDFVQANWEVFDEVSLKFLGTRKTIVTQALKRIGDSTFPDSKKWAYLCRVPGVAEDKEAAKALVNMGLLMNDSFTRRVARALLDRFFPSTAQQTTPSK